MKKLRKLICSFCCAVIAVAPFCGISAGAADTDGALRTEFPGAVIPQQKNYTWQSVTSVKSIQKTRKYFIIKADFGGIAEDLYISFPEEGGFRLQSLSELQKQNGTSRPAGGNNALFEPKSLEVIKYQNVSKSIIMRGGGDTVLAYTPYDGGFDLQVRSREDARILSITHRQISFAFDRKGRAVRCMTELPLIKREAIYGGGQRFNSANQVGQLISLTNVDCWSLPEYSYKNVPLFHSNRGYSIWFNMAYTGQADIGKSDPYKYTVIFDGANLDFYVFIGTPLENLKRYTDFTGTSGVSETWTYGFWTGAQNNAFENTGYNDTYKNITSLIEGYNSRYGFYPEACFAEGAAARNKNVTDYLNLKGVRTLGWFSPDLWRSFGTAEELLPNVSEYPSATSSGQPFPYYSKYFKTYGKYNFCQKGYIDFSNPTSAELIKSCWKKYWDAGVSGTMNDFGEWYPFEPMYYNGLDGDQMHNLMSYYYAKAAHDAWSSEKGNDYVLFSRSGCAGSQYWSGDFLGDQVSEYEGDEKNGYNAVIYAMISMGASGFNLYGADLGGLGGTPSNDLWNRWVQLSVFSPYMRQHGSVIHKPWEHGTLAERSFGAWYYFRKNIVPMIESAAIDAEKTANPIIKGMMMAYPYQLALADINDQYMFCDDFLVCPVTEENVSQRSVTLPKGSTWYELSSYEAFDGGQKIQAYAPQSNFPVYVKGGSVKAVQLAESMQLGAEIHDDTSIDGLLITAPDNSRTSKIYNKTGASEGYHSYNCMEEVYENIRESDSVFTVKNSDGSERQTVLVLGVTAAEVKAGGVPLKRLYNTPSYKNNEYGYFTEENGMTKILLPKGWKELTVTKGTAARNSVVLSSEKSAAVAENGVVAEFAADKPAEVSEINVKWLQDYESDYDIEYSADGRQWSKIAGENGYTVADGSGSEDTVSCGNVTAQYFRILSADSSKDITSEVYQLELLSKPVDKIGVLSADNIWKDFNDKEYDAAFELSEASGNGFMKPVLINISAAVLLAGIVAVIYKKRLAYGK